jgi:diguanylate cyclase (GGDEF)-like protein
VDIVLHDHARTSTRDAIIGGVAAAAFLALSCVLVFWIPNHAVTWWSVIVGLSAALMLTGARRELVLGLGSESELRMDAMAMVFFVTVLLVPPPVVPLLALTLARPTAWPRLVAGRATDLVGATAALWVAGAVWAAGASGPPQAVAVAAGIGASIAWCAANAAVVSLLFRAAVGTPVRMSPLLSVAAQVPVAVQAGLGLSAALMLRASAWNLPIAALLVWVNHRYMAARSATQASRADDKTGLPRHGEFLRTADREIARADRTGEPLSVLMLDLDRFRETNTAYGHLAGDSVLAAVADRVRGVLRLSDVASRFGGEEFSVLLPGTGGVHATEIAERMRAAIAASRVRVADAAIPVTVSVGVAEYQTGEPFSETLLRADQALYAAKAAGRNHVRSKLASPHRN